MGTGFAHIEICKAGTVHLPVAVVDSVSVCAVMEAID